MSQESCLRRWRYWVYKLILLRVMLVICHNLILLPHNTTLPTPSLSPKIYIPPHRHFSTSIAFCYYVWEAHSYALFPWAAPLHLESFTCIIYHHCRFTSSRSNRLWPHGPSIPIHHTHCLVSQPAYTYIHCTFTAYRHSSRQHSVHVNLPFSTICITTSLHY